MNRATQAYRIVKEAFKKTLEMRKNVEFLKLQGNIVEGWDEQKFFDDKIKEGIKEYEEVILPVEQALKEIVSNTSDIQKVKRMYFITVRPNTDDIDFDSFKAVVFKFLTRRCFVSFKMSFEQKGETEQSYGTGFHCHIIAQMKQASKGQVLRDTQTTFKHCASANCIQVDKLKTKDDVDRVTKYLVDYECDDDHKIVTKDADKAWREREGLQELYCQLSSPELAV